jgi:hypothetical protein
LRAFGSSRLTSRRTLARWSTTIAAAAAIVKPTTGQEASKSSANSGRLTPAVIEAIDA